MENIPMNISIQLLQNKKYSVKPVYGKPPYGQKKLSEENATEQDLVGIRLLYAASGSTVWEKNQGVIKMSELSPKAYEYVVKRFTNTESLKVFSGLGS